jgi:hypothetical protein
MATFGAGFIGDLLKSAHQTGVQDTSIKEIKGISKELQAVVDTLSSREEWISSDMALLTENLARLTKMRDDISKAADRDTQLLNGVVERLESTIKELQDIIHEVKANGSFKSEKKEDEKEEEPEIYDGLFKFLQTMPLLSVSFLKSIEKSTSYIITAINKSWADTADKLMVISSRLGILSTDIAVSNALSSNMLKDLRNYNIQEQRIQKEKDEKTGFLVDFAKKWGDPENSPIVNLTKKMNKFGNFMKNFSENIIGMVTSLGKVIATIAANLWRMMITFFVTVLPWILLIAAIVVLAIVLIYYIWKYFGDTIKKIWGWFMEYGMPIAKFVLGLLVDVAKWIWTALKAAVAFIYNNWSTIGPIIAAMTAAWVAYKVFQASMWAAQVVWNNAKWAFDAGMWAAQKAWQAGGFIMNLVKGIVPFMAAVFAWIAGPGLAGLISILAAIPVIGWIVLAIGAIAAIAYYFRDDIAKIIMVVYDWIVGVFKVAWNYYTGILDSMWNWVKGFWNVLWGGLKETVSGVLSNIGSALNPFNWFASGGEVSKPVKGIVGEAGPEAIIPLSGGGESKLSKALIEFFDYYLPFLKPTVDFLWKSFKPYMPILQSILDMIYNVAYSIIMGLSNLPGWLGGSVFKDLLSKMTAPRTGSPGSPRSPDKDEAFARILEMNNKDITESRLAVIGSNTNGIKSVYSAIKTQAENVTNLADLVFPSSDNSKLIKQGFTEMSKKIDQAMNEINGTVIANANKAPIADPAYELSKMFSRGQLGGKI